MSDYKISLGISLNNTDFENIKTQINSLEKDPIKISIDTKEASNKIKDLKKQIQELHNSTNKNLNLNVNLKQTAGQKSSVAKATQQDTNAVIQSQKKIQQAYKNTSQVYNKVAKDTSLARDGVKFKEVFNATNKAAQDAKKHFQQLLADEKAVISVTERFDDSKALQSFTVDIKRANGEVEKLHYSMKNLSKVEGKEDWKLAYSGAAANDKSIENQNKKRIREANNLQIALDKLKSEYNDKNAAKPIVDSKHIASLDAQYKKVKKAIIDVRNADNSASESMIFNAKQQKSELENMIKAYRNAESVATSLRSKGLDTTKEVYSSKIDSLIMKMKDSGVYTSGFQKGAENLRSSLSNATEKEEIISVLNGLDKLEAGYKRAAQSKKSFETARGIGQAASGLKSNIKDWQRLDSEINKFKTEINGAEVSVKSLLNALDKVKTSGDLKGVRGDIDAFKKAAKAEGYTLTETSASRKVNEEAKIINDNYKQMLEIQKQIRSFSIKEKNLTELGGKTGELDTVRNKLKELKADYETLKNTFGQKLTSNQFGNLQAEIDQTEFELKQLDEKFADTKAKMAQGIKSDFKLGNYDNQVSQMDERFNKLSYASKELRASVDSVKAAYNEMELAMKDTGDEVADRERLIQAEKKYADALEKTNNLIKIQSRADANINNKLKLDDDIRLFQADIDKWLATNSGATKEFKNRMLEIRNAAEGADRVKLNGLIRQFKLADKEADILGVKVKSTFDKLKGAFSQFALYMSPMQMFMYARMGLKSMFEQVKLIDSAMTELKKVTNETSESYDRFLTNAAAKAAEIGTTIDGLVESTASFARLGYEFNDAQGLAEVANIYAVVGDEVEGVEGATKSLISTMAAFKDEMNGLSNPDFALNIVDKINEVSNNFAISSGGLGEALQRSASSLAVGKNTLDESIGLIAAANTVVQNPDKVGNAMKTVSMRIRAAKTELEEAGESTEGMVESTATLRAEIEALSGVDIMASPTEFKSTYQILDELSQKWEHLNDISKATIIEKMAGKHQGNIFSSLMENFDIAREAVETSADSSGSAMKEHEKWQKSLEAQLLKVKAAWQGLSQSFLSSDILKVTLDGVIALVKGMTKLVDVFGAFGIVGIGIAAKGIWNHFRKGKKTITDVANSLEHLTDIMQNQTEATDASTAANERNTASEVAETNANAANTASETAETNANVANTTSEVAETNANLQNTASETSETASNITNTASEVAETNANVANTASEVAETNANIANTASETAETAANIANTASEVAETSANTTTAVATAGASAGKAAGGFGALLGKLGGLIAAHPYVAAAIGIVTVTVGALSAAFIKQKKDAEELAKKVEGLTDSYKENHNELKKLKSDYDTSNESSMISKYEKLSKGVDGLGRNISLTADEYSEYQSIVSQIAEQVPSLVTGYDEQGNAILSCKGNVEELTKAYEKLIHAQNQEILTNTGNIEKDFENTLKDAEKGSFLGMGKKVSTPSIEFLEKMLEGDYSTKEIKNLLKDLSIGQEDGVYEALYNAGIGEMGRVYTTTEVAETLSKQLKTDKSKIKGIIDDYYSQFNDAVEKQKTISQAVLSEAFDITTGKLKYGNIGEELQKIAQQTVSSLDYDFFVNLKDQGKSVEEWTKGMLDSLNSLSKADNKQIKTGFELETKFNDGDISYNQYINQLQETVDFIDNDLKVPKEVKNQIKLSLNSKDTLANYKALVNDLGNIGFDDKTISKFFDSLSSEEFSAAMKVIPKLDGKTTIKEIQALIDEELAEEFKFDITAQTEGITAFNTALSESRSATGLATASIETLQSRYKDLEGFNAAALFEKTANGIHLNNEELSRLEEQYASTNQLNIDSNLNKIITKYNDLTKEIKNCTDAQEKENLQLQADAYKDRIDELSTLSSQYEGLTSAFSKWKTAQEGAEEGDNYDSLQENLENIKELYKNGLVGTDKFKTAVQLMTNEDLANADISKIVSAYKEGYPKMQRYFTEGQKGCKNFLNDVKNLNSEWAHLNKDGSWDINFDSEEVAKELGVSVDFILQISKKLKDYGFEINFEDSSVDKLKTKIEQTEAKLKKLGQAPVDIDVDIEASTKNLGTIESEIEKAKSKIKEINNSTVEAKVKTAQLEDAQAKLEALIDKKAEISQPAFMNLNTSQVSASLVDALEKIQSYQNAVNEVNKLNELKSAGIVIDDSQLKAAKGKIDEYAKAIQGLDGDVKVAIGLEKDGSIDSIKKSFEEGKVKVDVNTDPALNKVEQLAENVEKIEDKDVTINVEVNGLDKVKELNKQINLATDIDGDIDKLSEYVKGAKALNELDDNIAKYVTAEIRGNAIGKLEADLNDLLVFADGAKALEDVESKKVTVEADVKGDAIWHPEIALNNLQVFAKGVKSLQDLDDVDVTATARVNTTLGLNGNGSEMDATHMFEEQLDNLQVFADGVKALQGLNDVDVTATARVNTTLGLGGRGNGNEMDATHLFEEQLDNLQVFAKGVKSLQGLDDVDVTATARVNTTLGLGGRGNGNEMDATHLFEEQLDNLNVFAKGVKSLQGLKDVDVTATARVNTTLGLNRNGSEMDATHLFEEQLDNLNVFADGVKSLQGLSDVDVTATARVNTTLGLNGNGSEMDATHLFEEQLDNLSVFAKGVKDLEGLKDVDVTATARVNTTLGLGGRGKGNEMDATHLFEEQLNNLSVFADGVKALQGLNDVDVTATARVNTTLGLNGNGSEMDATHMFEEQLDNLQVFADGVKALQGLGDVSSTVTARINTTLGLNGNGSEMDVTHMFEEQLDNLQVFADGAKAIQSIGGNPSSTVTARINTAIGKSDATDAGMFESRLNNLKVFAEGANALKGVGKVSSEVTAKLNTKLGEADATDSSMVGRIKNLTPFANAANSLKGVGDVSTTLTAKANGNAVSDKGAKDRLSRLTEFKSLAKGMTNETVTVSVTAKVDSENVNKAIDILKKVSDSGVFKDYNATVQVGAKIAKIDDTTVQKYKAPPKEGKVSYSVDPKSSVFTWTSPDKDGVVNYDAEVEALTDAQKHKRGTITYDVKFSGFPLVNGTANVNGTAFVNGTSGKAYSQGDWGTKKTTTALTGELGRELVVYKNRYWTVGDNGAEFATIPKGAIVFNHKQTEELFKNGKVTSNGGRGVALASGTAFLDNDVDGNGSFYGDGSSSSSKKSSSKSSSKSSNSDKESAEEFKEVLDWIEIALKRVQREIDKLDQKANNVYKSWTSRNTALSKEIGKVGSEINLQQQAYNRYMKEANNVGLSAAYKKKVQNGTIDIQTIKDENLKEKIDEYQQWYEKALDCKDTIEELKETEASLYRQRFDNVQTQYDAVIQGYEHTETMLNEYISQAETKGHIVSKKYYNELINNENNNISKLKQEQSALIKARDEAVASGAITKYSEDWYNMCNEIDSVTQAIEESTTALLEYDNAMREIDWSVFDLIQERISAVSEEADFLIELMSSDKLYDDKGKLTGQGAATMGLHAQKYNAYMYQADDYGAEVAELDKQIAKDPYDQELINRRKEILELQREMILNAQQEKEAIRDLVEEGINLELEALQELIDKKNEELESEKDLYEYQKKVKEQTEEIASLEKQMAAYSGDDSEEAKAKVQELKVSLEEAKTELQETEWDKYISDTSALLDDLYNEYELILNQRLDNIDYLLQQVVDGVNADGAIASALGVDGAIANAIVSAVGENGSINSILNKEATSVGTTLSNAMNNIWSTGEGNAKSILTTYGQGFQDKLTTTNITLDGIKVSVNNMVSALNKEAEKKTTANKTSTSAKKDPTKDASNSAKTNTKTTTTNNTKTTNTTKTTGDGVPKKGDKVKFVSGKYYYDSYGTKPLGSKNQGKEVYITNINKNGSYPYHISTGKTLGNGDLGWLKLNQISGYASGKKDFLEDEIAWTQENGKEFIIRPSDGAILTPLAKGDSVLNANASNNIWDMANNPSEFIKDNLNLGNANIPNNSNVNNNVTQNFENVVFSMPNVHSYNELLSQMSKDKDFEKLILSMSVDRLAGKSSLAKGKSIR